MSPLPSLGTLPVEINLNILKNCTIASLGRLARVSRDFHVLCQDDNIWKIRLIADYKISTSSAELLKRIVGIDFKSAYKRWKHYETSPYTWKNHGSLFGDFYKNPNIVLNNSICNGRDWFDSFNHDQAFIYLIESRKLSVTEAMIELESTTESEALSLSQGCTRAELLDLDEMGFNCYQRRVYFQYRLKGIKVNDLLGCEWFNTYNHIFTMNTLTDRDLTPVQALAEMKDLTLDQVHFLGNSRNCLERNDVVGLNSLQLHTLVALSSYGLTSDELRNRSWGNSDYHHRSLKLMIQFEGVSLDEALSFVDTLNDPQAKNISQGLPKDYPRTLSFQCGQS